MPRMRPLLTILLLTLGLLSFAPQAQAQVEASRHRHHHGGGTHIVIFEAGMSAQARRQAVESMGGKVVQDFAFIDAALVQFAKTKSTGGAERFQRAPRVQAVEEDVYQKWIKAEPSSVGSTPFPSARELLNTAERSTDDAPPTGVVSGQQTTPWGIERVKAPGAWKRTRGRGVKVAVIDTGIDYTHPDLAANYKGGINIVAPEAQPLDDQGHGTHVAGTIAAVRGGSVVGVAPEASLYAVKVLDKDGGGTASDIVEGITWATEHGMQVINMSLGGTGTKAMERAIAAALKAGVTVVAAAGNDPNAPVSAPANYPGVIAVSASTKEDTLAFFSTTGPEVAFIAPGHEILSDAPGGGTATHSGTSMATPHVAGLAALAIANGARGPQAVRAALAAACVQLPGLNGEQQGSGLPQADKMVGVSQDYYAMR